VTPGHELSTLDETEIEEALNLTPSEIMDIADSLETLKSLRNRCEEGFKKASQGWKKSHIEKSKLKKEIIELLQKKENHHDKVWHWHTQELDNNHLDDISLTDLKNHLDSLRDFEKNKEQLSKRKLRYESLADLIGGAIKENRRLRTILYLPTADYPSIVDSVTEAVPLDLDQELELREHHYQTLGEENKTFLKQIEENELADERLRKHKGERFDKYVKQIKSLKQAVVTNVELRKNLDLPAVAYLDSPATSQEEGELIAEEDLDTLAKLLSQVTKENDDFINQQELNKQQLLKALNQIYADITTMVEQINLYIDYSYDHEAEYLQLEAFIPGETTDELKDQFDTLVDKKEVYALQLKEFEKRYGDFNKRKDREKITAEKAGDEVKAIFDATQLTAFHQSNPKLDKKFRQEVFSGTQDYDRVHLRDLKRGSLENAQYFLNKGPETLKNLRSETRQMADNFIDTASEDFQLLRNEKALLIPIGGGNEIGGSCNLLIFQARAKTYRFFIDFGIRNIRGEYELPDLKMLAQYGMSGLNDLDGVFITHAHADHIGAVFQQIILPGLNIPIYMSPATFEIFQESTFDGIKYMPEECFVNDSKSTWQTSVKRNTEAFHGNIHRLSLDEQEEIVPGELQVRPLLAGHITGAVGYVFEFKEHKKTILYTGDFALRSLKSVEGASFLKLKSVDTIICEGTNLSKLNVRKLDSFKTFADKIDATIKRGGKVVIPAFSIGKAQEFVALIGELQKAKQSNIRLKVDGLAKNVTKICASYSPRISGVKFEETDPDIIVSSAGSMSAGTTIGGYVKSVLPDPKSLLIKGSFFDEEYSGWASNYQLDRAKEIVYGGERFPVACEIYEFKVPLHAELYEIEELINSLHPKQVYFVHTLSGPSHNVQPKLDSNIESNWSKNFHPIVLA
jgi:Cft2 family RNA processing exonuclease